MKTTRKKAALPRTRGKRASSNLKIWTRRAERLLGEVVPKARAIAALRKRAPAPHPVIAWTIEVEVVGQARMRQLNRETRGKDQPTDVLSFELPLSFRSQGLLGQLVICLPVLKAQARQLGHSQAQELQVLLVHGLLHLLGFDHEKSPRAAREMGLLEERLLGQTKGHKGLIRR